MKRIELQSKYLRFRTNKTRLIVTRQGNDCFSFIWKQSKQFYWNLDAKNVEMIKSFEKQSSNNFWIKQNHQTQSYF